MTPRRRDVPVVLVAIVFVGLVGWLVTVPLGVIGWVFVGPPLLMVAERLYGELRKGRLAERLERFRTGRCTRCGYDLRASPERCPECGRLRERPDGPLPRVAAKRSSAARRAEVDEAVWLMTLREPSPGVAWRTDEERQVAGIVERASCQIGGWPSERFLADDPFATMIEDWEGMVWFDIYYRLGRELEVVPSRADYDRFLAMTFREVVEELAGRVGEGPAVEEARPAGRFVSAPGRIGLLPPTPDERVQ